ncbi:hypothetical protein HS125_16300 [bacterium]|nr:hypothetical protein [bacterium]
MTRFLPLVVLCVLIAAAWLWTRQSGIVHYIGPLDIPASATPATPVASTPGGWVQAWKVLPYDPARDMDPDQVAPTQTADWRPVAADGGVATARGVVPDETAGSVFAQAIVECASAGEGRLRVGWTGMATLWWNGECVLDFAASPGEPATAQRTLEVSAGAGRNTLLLRITTDGEPARWCAQLTP